MNQADDFFTSFEPQTVKRAIVKDGVECPVLFCDDNPEINVLISEYLSENQLKYLTAFFHRKNVKINLVYVFSSVFDDKKKLNSNVLKFFIDNVRADLKDWLIPTIPVLAFGRAIYATTFDSDIQVYGFYDSVFNNTYFYSPFINNRVYPVDPHYKILAYGQIDSKTGEKINYFDCWETHFAEAQMVRAAQAGDCSVSRLRQIKIVQLDDPNGWLFDRIAINSVPENEQWAAVDIETSGLNLLSDKIGDVTISFDGWTAYHLNWEKVNPRIFSLFLQSHKLLLANGKFDLLALAYHGCDLAFPSWDTMIAGHLLNEMRSNSLKSHAFVYTNYGGYDLDLEKFKIRYPGLQNYLQIPDGVRIPYAGFDAAITYQVWQAQVRDMKKDQELWDYYHSYCLPMLKVFTKAEYKGFCVDWNKVNEVGKLLKDKIQDALIAVRTAFNNPTLNPNKKQELGKFIESLGWPCIKRNKAGFYCVAKSEFAEWEKMGHSEVKTLIEYSKWMIAWNTFIGDDSVSEDDEFSEDSDDASVFQDDDFFSGKETESVIPQEASGLWKYKGADSRVHTTFWPFMTNSKRHRSSSPNLQNIPKRNKEVSSIVRQCYVPPDTVPCTWTQADEIWVFDRLNGVSVCEPGELVEIGVQKRIKVKAGELVNYAFFEHGYRAEYFKKAEVGEWLITETDGSNIQAMVAASMSHDENLCNVFLSGGDFHSNNAYHILAKHQLFKDYIIKLSTGEYPEGMEYTQIPAIYRNGELLESVYFDSLLVGDKIGNKVIEDIHYTERKLSYEEYCANAKKGRCGKLRDIGKAIGLSFIFGASANNLAGGTLRQAWNPKMCEEFIRERNLEELQRSLAKNRRVGGDELLYLTVATFFRDEFFKLYPTLEKWIQQCATDASLTGYRRSPWGSLRLLPQLTTTGKHAEGGYYKNLSNIAVNSPVQDFETVVMAKVMIAMDTAFEDLGYLSYIVGTVHDAVVTVNHKSEIDSCLRIALEAFKFDHPATYGMPYSGECNVANYEKGEYWGSGSRNVTLKDVESFPIIQKRHRQR